MYEALNSEFECIFSRQYIECVKVFLNIGNIVSAGHIAQLKASGSALSIGRT